MSGLRILGCRICGDEVSSCVAFLFRVLLTIPCAEGGLVDNELNELFAKEYERPYDYACSAPGVLHLLGEHTEFARGHVLSIALPQTATVALSFREDSSIRLYTRLYDERKRSSISNLKYKKEDRWANLIKGVMAGLDTLGCVVRGVNVFIDSDIPDGRGLGASSAICIAATLAFCRLHDFHLTDAQVVYVAHTAETQFIQRPSRVSTCYASLHAHAGAVFSLDLRSLEYRHLRLTVGELHFFIIDSMVPPLGSQEEYVERMATYQEVKIRLKPIIGKRELRDLSLREVKELVADLPDSFRRLAIHIAGEEEREHQAVDSIESGQVAALGKILHRSHDSLRDNLEISCPELDWMAKHYSNIKGCLTIRLSGKGFGACAVMIASGNLAEIEPATKPFLDEYERIFGFPVSIKRVVVASGARMSPNLLASK